MGKMIQSIIYIYIRKMDIKNKPVAEEISWISKKKS